MLKTVCVVSALSLLGACSHYQPKKVTTPHFVTKSFFETIKTKKPAKFQEDMRVPASAKTVPGLKEFMAALRANPNFLKVPVGNEVVKENSGTYDGQTYKDQDKTTYIKQNKDGYFTLEFVGEDPAEFYLYDNERLEGVEEDINSQGNVQSFKKISATKFLMTFKFDEPEYKATCEMVLDLTSSSELQESSCKTASGDVMSQTKIVSVKPVNVQDYAATLKSIKIRVSPNALQCPNTDSDSACNSDVEDGEAKDWSYLLK